MRGCCSSRARSCLEWRASRLKHECISIFEQFPTPSAALEARAEDVFEIIKRLGLFPGRMRTIVEVSTRFLTDTGEFEVGLEPERKIPASASSASTVLKSSLAATCVANRKIAICKHSARGRRGTETSRTRMTRKT